MAGDPFSSHPYPSMKEVKAVNYYCEVCEKEMKMKDKAAHERSKKHAKNARGDEQLNDTIFAAASSDRSRKDNRECHHCHEVGHAKANCPSLPREVCFNCQETGHRKTECPNPRVIICRNCNKPGHMSKECSEPLNPANIKCRNCETLGHMSRDCPEPKDWSKVQCKNCGNYGHTVVRCQGQTMEADTSGWDNGNDKGISGWDGLDSVQNSGPVDNSWDDTPRTEDPSPTSWEDVQAGGSMPDTSFAVSNGNEGGNDLAAQW